MKIINLSFFLLISFSLCSFNLLAGKKSQKQSLSDYPSASQGYGVHVFSAQHIIKILEKKDNWREYAKIAFKKVILVKVDDKRIPLLEFLLSNDFNFGHGVGGEMVSQRSNLIRELLESLNEEVLNYYLSYRDYDTNFNIVHYAALFSETSVPRHIFRKINLLQLINEPDNQGRTPLMIAAMHIRHKTTFDLLLYRGADLNLYDNEGNTALHLAAREGLPDMVRAVTARLNENTYGIIYATNNLGQTPLISAVISNNQGAVASLLSNGAAILIDHEDNLEQSALSIAVANNNAHIVSLLFEHGAINNIDMTNVNTTAEIMSLLLENSSTTTQNTQNNGAEAMATTSNSDNNFFIPPLDTYSPSPPPDGFVDPMRSNTPTTMMMQDIFFASGPVVLADFAVSAALANPPPPPPSSFATSSHVTVARPALTVSRPVAFRPLFTAANNAAATRVVSPFTSVFSTTGH